MAVNLEAENKRLRTDNAALKDVMRDLVERIAPCARCGGTGDEHFGKLPQAHACAECGGQGEVLDATAVISDIRNTLAEQD